MSCFRLSNAFYWRIMPAEQVSQNKLPTSSGRDCLIGSPLTPTQLGINSPVLESQPLVSIPFKSCIEIFASKQFLSNHMSSLLSTYYGPVCLSYNSFFSRNRAFSHNKSAGTMFQFVFTAKRTGHLFIYWFSCKHRPCLVSFPKVYFLSHRIFDTCIEY